MNRAQRNRAPVGVPDAARHRAAASGPRRRGRTVALTATALTGVASSIIVGSGIANAAPLPAFPDNIVTFPDRDMITAEGFSGDLTVKVYRGTQLMGAARGTGPDFEVNHPGGACWGQDMVDPANKSFPQVTPDIQGGDRIVIERLDNGTPVEVAESTVQGAAVDANGVTMTSPTTFTVTGRSAGVLGANMEQRIVNPDLTDTSVARRDIRAVVTDGNVMEPAPNGGYSSRLEVSATGAFTAYYDFTTPDDPSTPDVNEATQAAQTAKIAATTDIQRLLSWQQADGAANRQGLTIAEQGEHGGPGMGGCPSGPGSAAATPGSYSVVWANGQAQVNWTPAVAQPGAPEITAYSVQAVQTTATAGEFSTVGKRTAPTATRSLLTGLTGGAAAWKIEVRPITGATAMGAPFGLASGADPAAPPPTGDTIAPTVSATQNATNGAVTLSANEANVDMYYTTDGSRPTEGNATRTLPSATATLYTGPIPITASTNLRWVGFDRAGNVSALGQQTFTPKSAAATAPGIPAGLTATPGVSKVDLKWTAPASNGGSAITGYTVTATAPEIPATASTPLVPAYSGTVTSTTTSATVGSLTNGREYTFSVTATNIAGTSGSSTAVKARPGDAVSISIARNKAGDIRLTGTGSTTTARYTVYLSKTAADVGNSAATGTVQLSTAANLTVTPAVLPATGVGWELKKRDAIGAPVNSTTLPRGYVVWIQSNEGGLASAPVA